MLKRGVYFAASRLAFNGLRTEIRHFPVHSIGRWWVVQPIRRQKGMQKRGAHRCACLYRVVRGDGQALYLLYEAYSPEGDLLVSVLFRSTWSSYCFFNQPCCSFIHSIIDSCDFNCDFNSAITASSACSLSDRVLLCMVGTPVSEKSTEICFPGLSMTALPGSDAFSLINCRLLLPSCSALRLLSPAIWLILFLYPAFSIEPFPINNHSELTSGSSDSIFSIAFEFSGVCLAAPRKLAEVIPIFL